MDFPSLCDRPPEPQPCTVSMRTGGVIHFRLGDATRGGRAMSYEQVRGLALTATMAILSLTLAMFAVVWSSWWV